MDLAPTHPVRSSRRPCMPTNRCRLETSWLGRGAVRGGRSVAAARSRARYWVLVVLLPLEPDEALVLVDEPPSGPELPPEVVATVLT